MLSKIMERYSVSILLLTISFCIFKSATASSDNLRVQLTSKPLLVVRGNQDSSYVGNHGLILQPFQDEIGSMVMSKSYGVREALIRNSRHTDSKSSPGGKSSKKQKVQSYDTETAYSYRPVRVTSPLPISDDAADWVDFGIKPDNN